MFPIPMENPCTFAAGASFGCSYASASAARFVESAAWREREQRNASRGTITGCLIVGLCSSRECYSIE
jgi:hypothetical protein